MDITALRNDHFARLEKGLAPSLTYHGVHHTREVVISALEIAALMGVHTSEEIHLLEAAALLHDSGFLEGYKSHEESSCEMARRILPAYHFSPRQIDKVCDLIMATKIPQNPKDELARILCDADLDYLGRDDYYPIAGTLFAELKFYEVLATEKQWVVMQIRFLESHKYWTPVNQRRRESEKQKRIAELKAALDGYKD